ncbi:hypothetical protein V8C40DRAFT_175931 [Trichoderma camerunense]
MFQLGLAALLGTARPCKEPTILLLCWATACFHQKMLQRLRCLSSAKTHHKRHISYMRGAVSLATRLLYKLRSYYNTSIHGPQTRCVHGHMVSISISRYVCIIYL